MLPTPIREKLSTLSYGRCGSYNHGCPSPNGRCLPNPAHFLLKNALIFHPVLSVCTCMCCAPWPGSENDTLLTVFMIVIPGNWHFWKKQLILGNGLCYKWPTHIKRCPTPALCEKSWVIQNQLAVIPAVCNFLSIKICMGNIKTGRIEWYHFPVAHAMYVEVTLVLIFFPIQTSIEQKCKCAPLVLHQFVRHKYLHEDQSMGQTVV